VRLVQSLAEYSAKKPEKWEKTILTRHQSNIDEDTWSVKVFGMSLSRLETSQSTPSFFKLYFLRRLKMSEISPRSRIMLGKAFCGNGFIHLNIAEIHEDIIGGQKTCSYFGNQGSK